MHARKHYFIHSLLHECMHSHMAWMLTRPCRTEAKEDNGRSRRKTGNLRQIRKKRRIAYQQITGYVMPKHTSVTLGDHFQQFVDVRVQAGQYGSASEVVRDALRLLEHKEREEEAKMQALRAAIEIGINSGRAKDSSMKSVLAEARARRT